jgi:voltage-gated potassium channel
LLDQIDTVVCAVFLIDFGRRFRRAPSKWRFMRWGWIDLLSSIPAWDPLRWGRAARVFRILRVMRSFRSLRYLLAFLYRDRSKGTIVTAAIAVFLLTVGASIAILMLEGHVNPNISTPFSAIWWAISTITTVGYGDVVPLSDEGRIVAMILMVCGIALFGVFTGLFARLLMGPETPAGAEELSAIVTELRELRAKLDRIEHAQREQGNADQPLAASSPPVTPIVEASVAERSPARSAHPRP